MIKKLRDAKLRDSRMPKVVCLVCVLHVTRRGPQLLSLVLPPLHTQFHTTHLFPASNIAQ
jgi:hypothetical protein